MVGEQRFLFAPGRISRADLDVALDEEKKLPLDTQPWWVCRSGIAAMNAAINGNIGPLQLKPASEWPGLRNAARAQLSQFVAKP